MKLFSSLFTILLFAVTISSHCNISQEDIDENKQALDILKKADKEAKQIRMNAAKKIAILKEQTKEDYFKLKENVDIKRLELEKKADLESLKIKAEAERKALELKSKAEIEALKVRQGFQEERREQELKDGLGDASPIERVSGEWKAAVIKQFNEDINFMEQIVIDGEVNELERKDFLGLFKNQKEWFDKTVSNTRYVGDSNYQAITKKNFTIHRIVVAQKKADKILKDNIDKDLFGTDVYKKMRLAVLYELNSLVDKEELTMPEIKDVVMSVINDIKEQKERLEVGGGEVTELLVSKLEKELQAVKREQEGLKGEDYKFEEDIKVKLEEKNRRNLELEVLLQKARQSLEQLKQEANSLIEAESKKNLDLQIRLNEVKNELEALKDKIKKGEVQQKQLKAELGKQEERSKKLEQETLQLKNESKAIGARKKELEVELDKKIKNIRKVENEIKQKEFELKRSLNAGISDKENISRLKMESELVLKEKNEELKVLRSQLQECKRNYNSLKDRPEDERLKELSLEVELQAKS